MVLSLGGGNADAAILGEFDQNGQVFTVSKCDQELFPPLRPLNPKRHGRIFLVAQDGLIGVRKQFPRRGKSPLGRFRHEMGFWVETAALLRVQGLSYVPRILRIDPQTTSVTMDYIRGENLRDLLHVRSGERRYETLRHTFAEALREAGPPIASEVTQVLRGMLARGVAPRDINAANFVQAAHSGRIYIVDFHLSWLWPTLAFRSEAGAIEQMLRTI